MCSQLANAIKFLSYNQTGDVPMAGPSLGNGNMVKSQKTVSQEPTQSEGQRACPARPLGSRQRSCMFSTPPNALLNLRHRGWAQDTGVSSKTGPSWLTLALVGLVRYGTCFGDLPMSTRAGCSSPGHCAKEDHHVDWGQTLSHGPNPNHGPVLRIKFLRDLFSHTET